MGLQTRGSEIGVVPTQGPRRPTWQRVADPVWN